MDPGPTRFEGRPINECPRISARFDSTCPGCDSSIHEGDEIVCVDGVWVYTEVCDSED